MGAFPRQGARRQQGAKRPRGTEGVTSGLGILEEALFKYLPEAADEW